MKNKGFTLIELLAVIVILAIIALIATPIILGIINDARTQSRKRSAELAYTGVEYAITSYMYNNNGKVPTTVDDIDDFFKVENVTLTSDNSTWKIKENGSNTELCTVAPLSDSKGFTVTCNGLMDPKTITLSE